MFQLKRILRNSSIVLFYLSGLSTCRKIYLQYRYKRIYRILCFHWVGGEGAQDFEDKIVWLKKKCTIFSLSDLLGGELNVGSGNNVAITFDDGFSDFYSVILPVLVKHNVPATLFIPSKIIGLSPGDAENFAKREIGIGRSLLNKQNIIEISKSGVVDLQSHSRSHCDFGKGSFDELLYELNQSREEIESITGNAVQYLAFPFGDILNTSQNAFKALHSSNYAAAMTIVPGFNYSESNQFMLKRDSLDPSMNMLLFRAWLSGGYDLLKSASNWGRLYVKRFTA